LNENESGSRAHPLPLQERVALGLGRGPGEGQRATCPRLLITGFGPFPGAPANPTEALVAALAGEPPEAFGAGAFRAVLLPTDYRRSWSKLRRLYATFEPDIVVHFGLAAGAGIIRVERLANIRIDPRRPDAAGFAPRLGRAARSGSAALQSTFPAADIAAALAAAGFEAALSDDSGDYVCNATLYRSLANAPAGRRVGFIHVPPERVLAAPGLREAARSILRAACAAEVNSRRAARSA